MFDQEHEIDIHFQTNFKGDIRKLVNDYLYE